MKALLLGALAFGLVPAAHARMDQDPAPAPAKLTPDRILAGIYRPWTGPLAEMGKKLKAGRDYVVWVHVPAQHPMDLRSSDRFRQWALATPVTELTISHNMIAFRCGNSEGATGMTGSSNLQDAKYLLAGAGLSMFFAVYTDGHLNPESEVDAYVTKNLAKRGAVFGAFEVSAAQCDSLRVFLDDFVRHPNRPFERFSNVGDPEKFEGGGCVTFASALLKKAGLLETVIPKFFRDFYAARYLLGGNLGPHADVEPPPTPWLHGKRRSISLNLFWENPWDYAPEDFPGYAHLRQMDPEKMLYALKQIGLAATSARRLAGTPLGTRVVTTANLVPTNSGSWAMEYEQTPIDDRFDGEMAAVGRAARDWVRAREREGYRVRAASAVGMPVLLVEKE
jgi:hypothetical protein